MPADSATYNDKESIFKKVWPTPSQIELKRAASFSHNCLIHGTSSEMFRGLEMTNFETMSPLKLLKNHKVAPLSGEITGGGLSSPYADCELCLGKLIPDNTLDKYRLDDIIGNYAPGNCETEPQSVMSREQQMEKIFYGVRNMHRMYGSNINEVPAIPVTFTKLQECQYLQRSMNLMISHCF